MSESQKKPRILTANPNRFKSAPEPEEKLSDYQKKIRRDREKKQQRLAQIDARETALNATSRLSEISALNKEYPITDYKATLDITPSKPVPEGINPFMYTPAELERSEMKEEEVISTNPVELDFDEEEIDFDELDTNEQVPPNIKRIGGIKRRKSRKLRKSPKKSRKSKRKTTRKVRRHRRR